MDQALNQKIDAFIAANKDQWLKDIETLVSINSVESAPAEGAPYGLGARAALDKTLELAAGMGFATRNCENHIGYAELPGVSICQLQRREGMDAVFVSRWLWDGRAKRREEDPDRRFPTPLQP